jgi:hypothetical protein
MKIDDVKKVVDPNSFQPKYIVQLTLDAESIGNGSGPNINQSLGQSLVDQIKTFQQPRPAGLAVYQMHGPCMRATYLTGAGEKYSWTLEAVTRKCESIFTAFQEIVDAEGPNCDLFFYSASSQIVAFPDVYTPNEYAYMVRYAVVTEAMRKRLNLAKYVGDF